MRFALKLIISLQTVCFFTCIDTQQLVTFREKIMKKSVQLFW